MTKIAIYLTDKFGDGKTTLWKIINDLDDFQLDNWYFTPNIQFSFCYVCSPHEKSIPCDDCKYDVEKN